MLFIDFLDTLMAIIIFSTTIKLALTRNSVDYIVFIY